MFIVIDWLDGSGKGTQTKLIVEQLEKKWKKVLLLDYPRYWEKSAYFVEEYLNGKYWKNVSAKLSSLFFALDRFDDSHEYKDDILKYDYVISNRYVSANMIHQSGKIKDFEKRIEFLDWLAELEYEICWIPKPDKVLFLDVTPEVSEQLIEKKEQRDYITDWWNKDIHEADENHLKDAYQAALQVVEHFPEWGKIECCEEWNILPIDTITQKILTKII
jgi:dTMP kinase